MICIVVTKLRSGRKKNPTDGIENTMFKIDEQLLFCDAFVHRQKIIGTSFMYSKNANNMTDIFLHALTIP